jgi:AraC-like DNA-binding protein
MPLVTFSTNQMPAELDDETRFARLMELFSDLYCVCDLYRTDDQPFGANFSCAQTGTITSTLFDGTVGRSARTKRHIAKDPAELFAITFNRSPRPVRCTQNGRETVVGPGGVTLLATGDVSEFNTQSQFSWVSIAMSRERLMECVADPGNLLLGPLDPGRPALRHLSRYLDMVLAPDNGCDDPAVAALVETTLLDLVALALGARDDAADVARQRGLRAARLQEIVTTIKARFADPAFSSEDVARAVGLSPRYVNELLQETDASLAERVLELRLQKARTMLRRPQYDRLKVGDIALACGFGNISYFNRCFRRRFGATPTQYRGADGDD